MRNFSRRDASLRLAGLVGGAGTAASLFAPTRASAQRPLVEGQDFITIEKPVDVPHDGKIEVIEFFWYGCPHCYAFEPFIEPWAAQLPPDVHFKRVAYGFDEVLREVHQQVYCTLEAMNLVDAMHAKVYDRFHRQKKPINSEGDMLQFAREEHLDVDKVRATWRGFAVESRIRKAKATCQAYSVDFVPLIGIQGQFLTTPRTDQDGPRALAATDNLIARVRKGG